SDVLCRPRAPGIAPARSRAWPRSTPDPVRWSLLFDNGFRLEAEERTLAFDQPVPDGPGHRVPARGVSARLGQGQETHLGRPRLRVYGCCALDFQGLDPPQR